MSVKGLSVKLLQKYKMGLEFCITYLDMADYTHHQSLDLIPILCHILHPIAHEQAGSRKMTKEAGEKVSTLGKHTRRSRRGRLLPSPITCVETEVQCVGSWNYKFTCLPTDLNMTHQISHW